MSPRAPAGGAPRRAWAEVLLVLALAAGVFVTRTLNATPFVTWDEPAWTYRSARFLLALLRGDLRGTALTGHPGVTTTWLGALGLAWNVWLTRTVDWAQVLAVGALPSLEVHDADTMRLLAGLLPAAKSALPLAHVAIALAVYGLMRRLAGWASATVTVVVLAVDPYSLALSRVLHIDALTAGLMLVSVLAALCYRGVGRTTDSMPWGKASGPLLAPGRAPGRRRCLVLSAVAAGLAALTKTYGGFVAPVVLALVAGNALRGGAPPSPAAGAHRDARQGSSLRSARREVGAPSLRLKRRGEGDDAGRPADSPPAVVPSEARDLDARGQVPPGGPPLGAGVRRDASQDCSLRCPEGPPRAEPRRYRSKAHLRGLARVGEGRLGPERKATPCASAGPRPAAPAAFVSRGVRRDHGGSERRWTWLARDVALWAGAAMGAYVLAWPAMWVAPARTLGGVLGLSLEYATAPGDATSSYFRGALTTDPGAAFYPVALVYRTTPLVLAGVILAVVGAATRRRAGAALTWGLLAYAAVHLALITLSAKKFDRYLLPALLALDVVAALAWFRAVSAVANALARRHRRERPPGPIAPAVAAAMLAAAQAAFLLAPLPASHALAYYNPLVGGLAGAAHTVPVGWGEGVEAATRYLAALPDAGRLRVVTWAVAGVAPGFPGEVRKPTTESLPNADYVVIYVGDVQGQTPLAAAFADQVPAFEARVGGQPYVWVYRNAVGEALAEEIAAQAAPGDAIVLNAPSAFERQYRGDLAWAVVTGDEAQVARELRTLTYDSGDVFYVAYDGQPCHEAIRRLLARHGLLLGERPFAASGCRGTLYHYRLLSTALEPTAPSSLTDAVFGGELALEAYGLSAGEIEYRRELGVALQWRTLARPGHDYHASVRLVDADGRTWGQYDAPLEDAEGLRASTWDGATEHRGDLRVTAEPGTPPGDYRVLLNLYRLEDLGLLEVVAGDGAPSQQLDLGPVRVRSATVPPRREELAIPQPVEVNLGGRVEVLGYALSRDVVPWGEEVAVTLYWRCLAPLADDYDLLLRLVAPDGREVGRARARPAGNAYPTDRWHAGEVLRYAYRLRVDADATGGRHEVRLNLVSRADGRPLADVDALLTALSVERVERLFEAPPIASPQGAQFGDDAGDAIALLGYELAQEEVAPGEELHLTLYWRALGPIERSYTAFVHLLDGGGVVRGQRDSVPALGGRPTDGWVEGEVIVDAYTFAVADDAPAGPHQIEVGLYDPTTGERLPVTAADGLTIPERCLLLDRTITVRP